jgi:hypothetical protein
MKSKGACQCIGRVLGGVGERQAWRIASVLDSNSTGLLSSLGKKFVPLQRLSHDGDVVCHVLTYHGSRLQPQAEGLQFSVLCMDERDGVLKACLR